MNSSHRAGLPPWDIASLKVPMMQTREFFIMSLCHIFAQTEEKYRRPLSLHPEILIVFATQTDQKRFFFNATGLL